MAKMRLISFRVTEFRSVVDSDWIEVGEVTALIGTNESGKTNLLVPLWKLNPANDGAIDLIADVPRKRYSEIKNMDRKPTFIRGRFALSEPFARQIATKFGCTPEDVSIAEIGRDFDGKYYVSFPAQTRGTVSQAALLHVLDQAHKELASLSPSTQAEGPLKEKMLEAVAMAQDVARESTEQLQNILPILEPLESVDVSTGAKRSVLIPRFERLQEDLAELAQPLSRKLPGDIQECRTLVRQSMPSFVYYSNYGNLDSEIYLPHVIENMERDDLGSKEQAKVRTLRVLFDFVKLSATEIRELGKDFDTARSTPTEEQLEEIARKKKERSILLTSASARLTARFREWWQQGDYVFDFEADGDHFRVWVSDDRRPEKIELENRSTGLQWFLSFFLVFLVESEEAHAGSILLLDEPGLSLHPLAQRDLSLFFEGLAKKNQIAYTTHSPFLVDPDHLDRVKAVYVDESGATAVSANLRAAEGKAAERRSVYPVHAALGLSVSSILLEGCQPVIVEGPSDQLILSALKTLLVARKAISPKRELLFVPAGGAKGASAVASLLAGRDDALPIVLFDSDTIGLSEAKKLRDGLYKGLEGRVLLLGELLGMENAEVEDLVPTDVIAFAATRAFFRGTDEVFDDICKPGEPIVGQIEEFARRNGVQLSKGWKVELAAQAKSRLLKGGLADEDVERLARVFASIVQP